MTITLKIRPPRGETVEVEAELSMSVAEFKEIVASRLDVASNQQRLIYSGRILKDDQTLQDYSIEDGQTLHLVKGANRNAGSSQASRSASGTTASTSSGANAGSTAPSGDRAAAVPHLAAGQGAGNPLSDLTGARYAGYGLNLPSASMFGPDGGMGPAPDMEQMMSLMENPMFAESFQQLLSDPSVLTSNPMFQQMPAAQREQMTQAMRSESFRELLRNPQAFREMMQRTMELQRLLSGNQGAAASGGFPAPGNADEDQRSTNSAFGGPDMNALASLIGNPLGGGLGGLGGFGNFGGLGGSGAGATAAPVDNRPPEERYESQLRQLNELGFYDFDRNVRALRRSGGNVQGAIEAMLDGHV